LDIGSPRKTEMTRHQRRLTRHGPSSGANRGAKLLLSKQCIGRALSD